MWTWLAQSAKEAFLKGFTEQLLCHLKLTCSGG